MFKRKSIRLPDATVMSAALADVRAVQLKYDARIMFMLFLDRAALIGSQLKALGFETDESIESMFKSAVEQAKKSRKAPTTFNPDEKPASGKAS